MTENLAKQTKPAHLQRCMCWDTLEGGWRCYVYDDISKYWCTQATSEHDPNGYNHVSDYADYRITHWMEMPPKPKVWKKLSEEFPPSGKRILLYNPRCTMSFHAETMTRNGVIYIKYSHGIISNTDELQGGVRDYMWIEETE